jgi:tetratricopeptide (TPR) repeat protein
MPTSQAPHNHARRDALERLYILWIVSSFLLLAAALAPALVLRSSLRAQNEAIERLATRLNAAEIELVELRARPQAAAAPIEAPTPVDEKSPAHVESAESPAAPVDVSAPPRIESQLARILDEPDPGEFVVHDEAAARAALAAAAKLPAARVSNRTWERLAILAALLNESTAADDFAQRSINSGRPPLRYFALAARRALAENRPADALAHARRLNEHAPASALGKVYMAAALIAAGQNASADEVFRPVGELLGLTGPERLLAARISLELEDWPHLRDALKAVPNVPAAVSAERDFLNAVNLLQQGRSTDAFTLLDNLNAGQANAGGDALFPLVPLPRPWEVQVWRAVALMRTGQADSARRAFETAAQSWPDRPAIWYWLGILNLKQRDFDAATRALNNALARSAAFAPAWEALATIALERNDTEAALSNLDSAIQANPRRAGAHFLKAIVHAKAGHSDDAADGLRSAFALAPAMIEDAAKTEVLARLFTLEQLRAFAAPAGDATGTSATSITAGDSQPATAGAPNTGKSDHSR